MKKALALILALVMAAALLAGCSGSDSGSGAPAAGTPAGDGNGDAAVPTIDNITLSTKDKPGDYADLTATIQILTDRTDIVDDVYMNKYVPLFNELYPNITVEYEAVSDYENSLKLRMTTGDWGDICFIPAAVTKDKMGDYFIPLGDQATLDGIYNFIPDKSFEGTVYGICNGGNANGVAYNKRVWRDAGINTAPTTPEEFLADLQKIKDKGEAIPLYTNFADSWCLVQWDSFIFGSATGDPEFRNKMLHMKDPFADRGDGTGPYAVFYVMYEAVARGLVEDSPSSTDWESSKNRINKGEIATMVIGSWAVQQFKEAGDTPEDVCYMPFPISVNGKVYAGAGGNYAFGINKKSSTDNQIAAMVYIKWLLEASPMYTDEGSVPALKTVEMPAFLADFEGVELVSNAAAPEGEDALFDEVNNESEVGINTSNDPKAVIIESALKQTATFDELMADWNAKWSKAQDTLGVEVNQ